MDPQTIKAENRVNQARLTETSIKCVMKPGVASPNWMSLNLLSC